MSRDIKKELVEEHGWDSEWFETNPEEDRRLILRHDSEHENEDAILRTRPGRTPHTHPKQHKIDINVKVPMVGQ